MRKSTILSFVTFSSCMYPLAWKQFCLVTVLTILFTPLAIVWHEILAEVKFQIVSVFRHNRFSCSRLLVRFLAPGASVLWRLVSEFSSLRFFNHFFYFFDLFFGWDWWGVTGRAKAWGVVTMVRLFSFLSFLVVEDTTAWIIVFFRSNITRRWRLVAEFLSLLLRLWGLYWE